jgi:PAS domain S-box-containing protein
MDRNLRVLIVEDSESDAGLLVRHLERAGYVLIYDRVQTAEEMSVALGKREWDIIIADYAMPRFNAPAALRLLQASGRDLPFIVVSGTIGEDTAVAMMKAGAHDYVMKGNLTRLAPAVRRELGDAEVRRKRRRAEEALRQSEERYRALYEDNPSMYFTMDAAGTVLSVNSFGAEQLGYTVEELLGQPVLKVFHPDDREAVREQFARCLQSPMEVAHWEFRKVRKDGSVLWVREAARAARGPRGNPVVLVVCEDITERKRAEEELFNSRQMLQLVLDNIPQRIFWKDRHSAYLGCNRTLALDGGYNDPSEIIGKTDYDTAWAAIADLYRADDREVMETGQPKVNYEEPLAKPDGSQAWVRTSKVPLRDKGGRVIGVLGMYEDITERKEAEEERVRLVTAVEQSAEAIFIADTDWIIHYVNPAFERVSGYGRSEIVGQHVCILESDKHDKPFYDRIRETLDQGEVWTGRIINKKKNGTFYHAEATASPVRDHSGAIINYVAVHRDITHEVTIERQLRQAQKMEAIGTLAGGIAHDFNNILAAIIGFTEIAMSKVPQASPVQHDLEQVLAAGSRATDLVRQILTFSRQTEQELRPVQITHTAKEALKLLRSSLPTTIDIRQEIALPPEGGVVLADPTQIHQVLMNLCTNAAHAMRATGGILSVGLSEVEADTSFVARHPGLKVGPCVCLTVSDTGHGMDAAVMERVFEPYFTTKGAGEGTGLGLAVVQGIVRGCGGAVTVYSEPGHGTTFRVYLPRIEREIAPEPRSVEPLPTGDERILFVDDENAIVDLGTRMLKSLGYDVIAKTSSLEALETFRAQPDAFNLVITDMTMPALTGVELAKEMMAIRPDTPIILCTGFSDLINAKQAQETGIREFVMKPFVARTFAKTIRKVLEENAHPN